LSVEELNTVVMTAIGGTNVSQAIEGRERYPISVRYARELRDDPEALASVLVETPSGAQVPLSQLAKLDFKTGPPMVRSESGKLVGFVFVDVVGRPIADYVADAKLRVKQRVDVPAGQRLEWAGQ